MNNGFKFQIGQWVTNKLTQTECEVLQLRIENGHNCYRLSSGAIVHENLLF